MRRIRIEQKHQKPREDRAPVLPLDPKDPEVCRAKQLARSSDRVKSRI